MRSLLALLLLTTVGLAQPQPQQPPPPQGQRPGGGGRTFRGSPQDTTAITAIVTNQQKAFNAGDSAAYVQDFAESTEFTDLAGTVVTGRQAFQERRKEMFRTYFRGAHLQATVRQVSFVRPRVAIADIDLDITGYKSSPPGASARPGHPLRIRLKYVLTREGKGWVIAAGQETEWKKEGSQK